MAGRLVAIRVFRGQGKEIPLPGKGLYKKVASPEKRIYI